MLVKKNHLPNRLNFEKQLNMRRRQTVALSINKKPNKLTTDGSVCEGTNIENQNVNSVVDRIMF